MRAHLEARSMSEDSRSIAVQPPSFGKQVILFRIDKVSDKVSDKDSDEGKTEGAKKGQTPGVVAARQPLPTTSRGAHSKLNGPGAIDTHSSRP